ncbi:hypothetical protein Dimus_028392 [Dionaea muscipula]
MEGAQVVVGPTEDTVMALLDLLLDPLLLSKASSMETPSPSQEAAVAKQMHAVVLLYNYYHRKFDPRLEFLEFDLFCKLSVIFKPSLMSYMKLMRGANYDGEDDLDKQLSSTEKLIMDACNISRSLDASRDVPVIEGWPVTKVGVFLVDSRKENCLLLHSGITQGVWSLVEKEVDVLGNSSLSTVGKKRIMKKPLKLNQTTDETALRQLALAAVASVCAGFTQTDISILENHITYSLSKENAATCLYIMQCTQPVLDTKMLPLRDAMQSLKGPLVREEFGTWTSTPAVKYFHMLPYADILSDWLSRDSIPSASLYCNTGLEANNANSSLMKEEPREILVYKKRNASKKCCNLGNNHVSKAFNSIEEYSRPEDNSFATGGVPDKMDVDEPTTVGSPADDKARKFPDKMYVADLNEMIVPVEADSPVQSNGAIIPSIYDGGAKNDFSEDITAKGMLPEQDGVHDQSMVAYDATSKQVDKVQLTIGSKENMLSQTALKVLFRKREILSQQLHSVEDEIAVCDINIQKILSGGEDGLAVKMDTIIESCNDVYTKNATSIKDEVFQDQGFSQHIKRKRLSEANLFLHNSCKELDGICHGNNWILPRYRVVATSDGGGFRAEVTVKGADFECSSEGDVCTTGPRAARESAAAQILAKLRRLATYQTNFVKPDQSRSMNTEGS